MRQKPLVFFEDLVLSRRGRDGSFLLVAAGVVEARIEPAVRLYPDHFRHRSAALVVKDVSEHAGTEAGQRTGRPHHGWLHPCGDTRHQRKLFWMFNRPHRKIYIQVWPVEMIFRRALDIQNLSDGRIGEPRELAERNEELSATQP